MPKFNLAPLPQDLDPAWPPAPQKKPGYDREAENRQLEKAAGPLKPLAQFVNALASPDTKMGLFTGPVNGISKLGNAIGDLVQGKAIDTKDAWVISDKTARQLNPFRIGIYGQQVTAADDAGLAIGEGIGAELAGAAAGVGLVRRLGQLGQLKRAADAMKATQAVRRAAVAVQTTPKLKAAVNVASNVGQAMVGTGLAAAFLDQEDGNLANMGDAFGLKLPGRVDQGDNYLQALGKSLAVEGLAAPLAVIGAGSLFAPIRKGMTSGDLSWVKELADAELEPYLPRQMAGPALPPARDRSLPPAQTTGAPALPGYTQQGGAIVPYDSAISRSLQEQTQIRQVQQQRQRLQDMGLLEMGEGGQLELSMGQVIDPEIRTQVRQLQTQRGQLLKAMKESPDQIQALDQQLGQIDQQIADLSLSGNSRDFLPPERINQTELNLDTRPELDTYLAHLDEMDDQKLREIHSRVYRDMGLERNAQELADAQARVVAVNERMAEIQAKADAGDITPTGAKRMLTKAQKELAAAQEQVKGIEGRQRLPESLVGDQLEMNIDQQLGLNLADEVQLPPIREITRPGSEYGYQTPDEYRSALQGWNRDQLRKLAMPQSSPEVAALVKAMTGRRVWQAKKSDIIDALVEIGIRRDSFLPPDPPRMEQGALRLTNNLVGGDAPLLDVPADLSVPGMKKVVDADGVEQLVPTVDFQARGMDPATRDRLKKEILQRAIDNGEVQAPVTPLPNRPQTSFNQGSFVDELFDDPTGQLSLAFAADQLPTYKASGKNADALIEEMRLRYEYNVLDSAAQQAQRDAYMAEKGWSQLSWDQRKQLGIMDEGLYRLAPYSERFQAATPAFKPELEAVPPRKPKVYQWKPGGEAVEAPPAAAKPDPAAAAEAKKAKAKVARETKQAANAEVKKVDNQIAAIKDQLDKLLKQSQGASC
jgi:hypothetical protein